MILIILVFILIICIVKIISNNDIAKEHAKTPEAIANVKNAKKVLSRAKYSIILLIAAIVLTILILISKYTEIDTAIIEYFSTDFYRKDFYNPKFFYIPAFILVSRQIIVEVKISEFLHKYFNLVEEEVDTKELLKSVLYKKKASNEQVTNNTEQLVETQNTTPTTESQPEQNQTVETTTQEVTTTDPTPQETPSTEATPVIEETKKEQ